MVEFPNKKYDIIYADPPWDIHPNGDGHFTANAGKRTAGTIKPDYPMMVGDDIIKLPVINICEADSLLFMWIVSSMFEDALKVGRAWGFEYSTIAFVWEKQIPIAATYTMRDCEICLLFRKGKIPQPRGKRNIRQFLSCKRGAHSDKPDEVRHRITEMFPTQSKIELFARVNGRLFPPMEGWDYWGNEAD